MKNFHIFPSKHSFFKNILSRCPLYKKFSICPSRKKIIAIRLIILLILATIIVIVLSILGVFKTKSAAISKHVSCASTSSQIWCAATSKCLNPSVDFCADQTNAFVEKLKKTIGITLLDSGQSSFIWNLQNPGSQVSDINIHGELYETNGLSLSQVQMIQKYLDTAAKLSTLNTINGTSGGLRGYSLENMVCTLDFRYKEMRMNSQNKIVPVSDNLNVKLKCGFLSQPAS